MLTVTASKLRNNIKYYLDQVTESLETLIVPRENEGGVVIMSMDEYNSMAETGYLTSTKANRKRLDESLSQLRRSKVTSMSLESLEAQIKQGVNEH